MFLRIFIHTIIFRKHLAYSFTAMMLLAASSLLLAQQPSGTSTKNRLPVAPKDLAIGNRFIFNVNGLRVVEEVVAERTIGERVYAVIRNSQSKTERLERSDEQGVYEYRPSGEQRVLSFRAVSGDSLRWTDGTAADNRSTMLYIREVDDNLVLGQTVRTFSGNYRFQQGGMTGGGMYATRFGMVSAMLFGNSSRTNRSVQLRGAVLKGQVFGDTTTTIPPRQKRTATAFFNRAMYTGISPNMTIQFYLPDTTITSLWILSKQNRLVRKVLDNTILPEGDNTIPWNGTNDEGRFVSPGDYWCVLQINGRELDRVELTYRDSNEVILFQPSPASQQRALASVGSGNPAIPLEFYVAKTANVKVSILSLDGKHVRTVLNERKIVGEQSTIWDGRDDNNKTVPKGSYLCVITTERGRVARSVVVHK